MSILLTVRPTPTASRRIRIKYGIGMIKEDAEQMPGVFFLKERKIVRAFRHKTIADEPDYLRLVGAG